MAAVISKRNDEILREEIKTIARLAEDRPASELPGLIRDFARGMGIAMTKAQAAEYASGVLASDIDWDA